MRCIMKANFAIMRQQDDLKCVVMAVHENKYVLCARITCSTYCQINILTLIIKPTGSTNFSNLFLE